MYNIVQSYWVNGGYPARRIQSPSYYHIDDLSSKTIVIVSDGSAKKKKGVETLKTWENGPIFQAVFSRETSCGHLE